MVLEIEKNGEVLVQLIVSSVKKLYFGRFSIGKFYFYPIKGSSYRFFNCENFVLSPMESNCRILILLSIKIDKFNALEHIIVKLFFWQ